LRNRTVDLLLTMKEVCAKPGMAKGMKTLAGVGPITPTYADSQHQAAAHRHRRRSPAGYEAGYYAQTQT
jgi:hypothetical protein